MIYKLIGQWKFLYWEICGGRNLWNSKLSTAGLSKKIIIVFFLSAILLLWPYSASSIYAVQPSDPNKDIGKPDTSNNQSTNNEKEKNENYKGPDFKEMVDQYPNETPIQEKMKKAIDIMKNGDPTKPKANNGKKNPNEIPEFTSELISVEEIIKNGKVVGKTVKTKSILVFKNKEQLGQNDEQWNRFGFDKYLVGEFDDASFKEMCKQSKGKISKDGQFCDVKDVVKNDINSQLSKLNKKWMDDDFYFLEGGSLEEAKEVAEKRGVFPPKLKNDKGKALGHNDGDFFKSNSNPNGLGFDSHEKKYEFVEEFTVDFSEAAANIPSDTDLSNVPIIPSSYNFSQDDEKTLYDYFSADWSELILPKAEAQETTNIRQFAMMGFTIAPPKLGWSITFAESICFPIWYPTSLHIKWGGFLGIEITHFHIHFAHKTICLELVFFRAFANMDIAAGFRLPIEVVYEDVPEAAFPNTTFNITAIVKPKDFTAKEYYDFCNTQDIKNDFFLQLTKALGGDPCERFAFQSFWYEDSSISGTGFEKVNFGHLINNNFNPPLEINTDGDEFIVKFILGAGIELKLINRTIDVCGLLSEGEIFSCTYGYNVDAGLNCTTKSIPSTLFPVDIIARIDLVNLRYPDEFVQKLKDKGWNCASFATPVGGFVPVPGLSATLKVPADCKALDEVDFPPSDESVRKAAKNTFSPAKFGPMKKSTDTPTKCEKPGPKCVCTNAILKQVGIPKTDFVLGIGVGMNAKITFGGGPVTADLAVGGSATSFDDTLKFNDIIRVSPDANLTALGKSKCVVNGNVDLTKCSNSDLNFLEFVGERNNGAGASNISITPTEGGGENEYITVGLDNFSISFQTFTLSAVPTLDFTGTFAAKVLKKFIPVRIELTPLKLSVPVDIGSGIPVGQHARTAPVSISIPVDTFGVIIPGDKIKEGEGFETFVAIGNAIINPDVLANMTVTNDLETVAPGELFNLGIDMITWTAINNATNITKNFTQNIEIVDTAPPIVFVPDSIEIEATAEFSNVAIGFSSATDVMDSSPTFSLSYNDTTTELVEQQFPMTPDDGFSFESDFPVGRTEVTWNATDDSGNVGQGIQNVTVMDTTPPMIMAPDDFKEFIEGFQARILFGMATISDLVDQMPAITTDREDASVSYICEDGTDTEEILDGFTCEDEKDPFFIVDDDGVQIFKCEDESEGDYKLLCEDGQVPEQSMIATFPIGTTSVLWTAIDDFGNNATDTQIVNATIMGDLNDPPNFIQDILEVPGSPCTADSVPCKFSHTGVNGTTAFGEITDRGGKTVVVLLPVNSSAITIATGSSEEETPAVISLCGGLAKIYLISLAQVAMFCGSVTVAGIFETTKVEFFVGDDIATISLPNSTAVTYDDFFFDLNYTAGLDNDMNQNVTGNFLNETFVLSEDFPVFNLDKIPPEIQTNNTLLPATDPFGTIVVYNITATDNLDPNPIVVCNPLTGSLFPMAPAFTVNCEVTDTSKNNSTGSLDVTIFLAKKTYDGLINIIGTMDIKTNDQKSLSAVVDAAGNSFDKGKNNPSINQLNAFKKIVNSKTGKKISDPDAATLLEAADLIIEQLQLLESANLQSSTLDNSISKIIGDNSTEQTDTNLDTATSNSTTDTQIEIATNSTEQTDTNLDTATSNSTTDTQIEIATNSTEQTDTNLDTATSNSTPPETQTVQRGIVTDDSNEPTDAASFFTVTNDSTPPDAQTADIVTDEDTGGGGDEHLTRPTFGVSHETFETIVDSGFRFNDQSFTINDNFHTPFAQQTVNIGEVNSFEAKIYADKRLKVQEFLFGIPNVGEAHLAELGVEIWYDYNGEIEDVKAIQKSNVIDKETIVVTHEKTKCQLSDIEQKCDVTNVSMVFLEPLQDKVMAVKAIDYKGRYQITYLNEGVDIAGESLNPMQTYLIPSNVRDQGLIKVTQLSKYSPYWQSDDGRTFEMNSFGSFKEINITFERFQDTGTAYSRLHSGFGGVMAYELKRATGIFDASELISDLPDFIPNSPPIISERITAEMKAKMLEQEEIAKEILDAMVKPQRNY